MIFQIKLLSLLLFCIVNFSCENNPSFENCNEDNCGICNETPMDDCIQDCNGIWGGNLLVDCNGLCGGEAMIDCDGNCIPKNEDGIYDGNFSSMDCTGICNGDAILDECGICNGPGSTYECGCSGLPHQVFGGEVENSGFTIIENHNFPIEPNQIFTGRSFNGNIITQDCGLLANINLNGNIQNIYDITFYTLLGSNEIPHDFYLYDKECDDDEITINSVCLESFPDNTIYINNNNQILYKSSIDISSFTFTIVGATVPIACNCKGDKYDCNNICGGDSFNDNGCCQDEVPDCLGDCTGNNEEIVYDSNNDGNLDSFCDCLIELNNEGCCCNDLRDCSGVCGGILSVDQCGICGGDNTYCTDCQGIINGDFEIDCLGICGGNEIDTDLDGICDFEDTCIGTAEECNENIDSGCDLPPNYIYFYQNNFVLYNVDFNIGGFQFDVDGALVSGTSGGDASLAGFTVSAGENTVLGFSFTGNSIQAGCGTLIELNLIGSSSTLNNIIFSDNQSNSVIVNYYQP